MNRDVPNFSSNDIQDRGEVRVEVEVKASEQHLNNNESSVEFQEEEIADENLNSLAGGYNFEAKAVKIYLLI